MTEPEDPLLPAPRSWPPGRTFTDAEAVAAACGACGARWNVHNSLAGFKLRCGCDAWVTVPAIATPAPTMALQPAANPAMPLTVRDEHGLVQMPGAEGETLHVAIRTDVAMAPGTVQRANVKSQARWTNRTLLEFLAMLLALLSPQVLAFWLSSGNEYEYMLPFASLASGALVAIVVVTSSPVGLLGFRRAPARHVAEALLATAVALALALGWMALLKYAAPEVDAHEFDSVVKKLGPLAALFVIAVTPAVLEEVMFRGLLQGRLLALLGNTVGMITTAAAFAICHGAPAVLPIHFGIGIYLGWLRERSGSLWPGMLMHFLYNGTLVLLAT